MTERSLGKIWKNEGSLEIWTPALQHWTLPSCVKFMKWWGGDVINEFCDEFVAQYTILELIILNTSWNKTTALWLVQTVGKSVELLEEMRL